MSSSSNLSGVIQNGQTLTVNSGPGAISANALVQTGGPGNEAWPVITIDRAAVATSQVLNTLSLNGGGASNNYARWESVVDSLGNIYIATSNTAGQGVNITKLSPTGASLIASTAVDATAHTMTSIRLIQLSNLTYAAVYADTTTGGVRFVVFDSGLNPIAGPTAVATGYLSGAVAYLDACPLTAGGFALVYVNSGHTAVTLQTYGNTGGAGLAATSVQATAGTASLTYLKVAQLSTGNLVVAMRQTATPAGTSFVIVTTAGASVQTNVIVDSTSTLGFAGLSVIQGFGFAVAVMDGTNIVAAVYTNAGAIVGSPYSAANTLNNTTYIQMQLTNDGTNFYLFYIQSAGGLTVVQLTQAGTVGATVAGLLSGTFTSNSSLGASISNNVAVVLHASITTGGQSYITLGLPDSSLGFAEPYVITGVTSVGSAAGTTGSYWPTVRALGDFTALFIYDQQSTGNTFSSLVKFAASAILGVAQNSVAATAGLPVTVNPGPGSYPVSALIGTNATSFDHSGVGGNRGVLYNAGVTLSNPATSQAVGPGASSTGWLYTAPGATASFSYTAPVPTQINMFMSIGSGGAGAWVFTINGTTAIPVALGSGTSTSSFFLGTGQTFAVSGTITAGSGAGLSIYAQKTV